MLTGEWSAKQTPEYYHFANHIQNEYIWHFYHFKKTMRIFLNCTHIQCCFLCKSNDQTSDQNLIWHSPASIQSVLVSKALVPKLKYI